VTITRGIEVLKKNLIFVGKVQVGSHHEAGEK